MVCSSFFSDRCGLSHHFLHDQYLAVSLLGGAESHRCLARKLRLRPGSLFLIRILRSPKRMVLLLPLAQARTTNFLGPVLALRGLLHGSLFMVSCRPVP